MKSEKNLYEGYTGEGPGMCVWASQAHNCAFNPRMHMSSEQFQSISKANEHRTQAII